MNVARYRLVSAGIVCVCVLLAGAVYADYSSQANQPADSGVKVLLDNMQAKDGIAQDLIAERLTVAEAITGFQAVDARRPSHLPLSLPEVGGESVEQGYA